MNISSALSGQLLVVKALKIVFRNFLLNINRFYLLTIGYMTSMTQDLNF